MATLYHIESFRQYAQLHFYTIRRELEDESLAPKTEAKDFFDRMLGRPELRTDLQIFSRLLKSLGDNCHSALAQNLLRHEDEAKALPPLRPAKWLGLADEEESPPEAGDIMLRLYCYPAGDRIIILFNGDNKTAWKAQDCSAVAPHFWFAKRISAKLDQARLERDWSVQDNMLLPENLKIWV